MDIPQVLEVLRPDDDWGPCAQTDSTYADLARMWRGTRPVPTEAEMLETWADLEATRSTREAARAKADTLAAIRTAGDPVSRGSRAAVSLLFNLFNDMRQEIDFTRAEVDALRAHVGMEPRSAPLLGRLTEPQIFALLAQANEQGAGEPR